MVRRYARRRFKPGRYILLLLILCSAVYASNRNSVPTPANQQPDMAPPAIANAPSPVSEPSPAVKEEKDTGNFTIMDEVAALQAIDIVSIENLELLRVGDDYVLDASLVFANSNPFSVHIKDSTLDATMELQKDILLTLGSIRLADVVLPSASEQEPMYTQVDVQVSYDQKISQLKDLLARVDPFEGRKKLPFFVEGEMSVQIALMPGLMIDRSIDLDMEYLPSVKQVLLEELKKSVQAI